MEANEVFIHTPLGSILPRIIEKDFKKKNLKFFEILPFLTKMAKIGKTQNTPTFFLNFLLEFTNIGQERATWEFPERCFALY